MPFRVKKMDTLSSGFNKMPQPIVSPVLLYTTWNPFGHSNSNLSPARKQQKPLPLENLYEFGENPRENPSELFPSERPIECPLNCVNLGVYERENNIFPSLPI
jgi:hypothetical protein